MLRHKLPGTLAVLGMLLIATPALALPFLSFNIAGTVAGQSQEVAMDISGTVNESFTGDSGIVMYGGEVGLGLPGGFVLFGHYYRHTNEFGEDLVADSGVDAYIDMSGNEWGGDLEWHVPLLPGSPLAPFLGAGASFAFVTLDGEVRYEGESAPLDTDTTVYRLYAVGGLKIAGSLGAWLRAGMAFGEDEAAQADYSLAGESVSVSANYQGYYIGAALGLSF